MRYFDYTIFPVILGISKPAYSSSDLQKMRDYSTEKITIGKYTKSRYQWTQVQRKLETKVREQKDIANIAKASGDDVLRREAQAKINKYTGMYENVSKAARIPTKKERMAVSGFRPVKAKKQLTNSSNDDIIKKIKSLGIKGDLHLPPTRLNLKNFSFDSNHINTERMHNIDKDTAEEYVSNAKISITTWKGRFEKFIGENGAAYIDKENKTIRTAFSSNEFDKKWQDLLEVLKKYGR